MHNRYCCWAFKRANGMAQAMPIVIWFALLVCIFTSNKKKWNPMCVDDGRYTFDRNHYFPYRNQCVVDNYFQLIFRHQCRLLQPPPPKHHFILTLAHAFLFSTRYFFQPVWCAQKKTRAHFPPRCNRSFHSLYTLFFSHLFSFRSLSLQRSNYFALFLFNCFV